MSGGRAPAGASSPHHGQTLVEFALVIPIFLLILFGLFDMGRFVYLNSTLSQAAREGARLASVEAGWIGSSDPSCNAAGGPVCPANVTALRTDVTAAVNRMMTPFAAVTAGDIYLSCTGAAPSAPVVTQTCATSNPGAFVSVRVVADFTPFTPIISSLVGTITTSGAATMVNN